MCALHCVADADHARALCQTNSTGSLARAFLLAVQLYDDQDVKLNDVVEVVGVLRCATWPPHDLHLASRTSMAHPLRPTRLPAMRPAAVCPNLRQPTCSMTRVARCVPVLHVG